MISRLEIAHEKRQTTFLDDSNIRRATRKHHAAEEKIRIVLDGLRGETSIAELCRREGIAAWECGISTEKIT